MGAGPETTGNEEQEREQLQRERPRIYVASLTDYNAGILHGAWIDATDDVDGMQDEINKMLARSPSSDAEEFAIHDFDNFGSYEVDEYDSLDWIAQIARGINEHGPAFAAWAYHCDHDEATLNQFEDAYLGDWSSVEEYAENLLDDTGILTELDNAIPDALRPYVEVDIEGFARDLELSGDVTSVEHPGGVWIFDGHL
jgi:antirestriction protein